MSKLKLIWLVSVLSVLLPPIGHAELIECPQRKIDAIYVQGDRDDGFPYANKLVIRIDAACGEDAPYNKPGYNQVYIDNSHPAYNGFLSAALTAYASNKKVSVYVNNSKSIGSAYELSILLLQ